jgi:hypothetical protein
LEIWRELNRGRDGEPSSLLLKKLAEKTPASKIAEAIRAATTPATPASAIDEMIRAEARRIQQETLQNPTRAAMRRMLQEMEVAERLMGRKRPVSPAQPDEPKPKPKRKPGGGRKPSLTPEQIKEGTGILRDQTKMTVEAARQTLRDAGIDAKDTPLYELVIKPAYGSR